MDTLEIARMRLNDKLKEITARKSGDLEIEHGDADDALIEFIRALGCVEEADMFEALHKWYA